MQASQSGSTTRALLGEIGVLEKRLSTLGLDGDCSYERRLAMVYHQLLAKRKRQLESIRIAG